MVMGPSPPLCSGSLPTWTSTWTSPLTTPGPTRLQLPTHLRHRAGPHSSTLGALEKEKAHVMDALLENGYPKRFIHLSVSIPHPPRTTVTEKPKATVCLPYIKGVLEPLKRVLQIRTVLRPHRTLKQTLVSKKGSSPSDSSSNVNWMVASACRV